MADQGEPASPGSGTNLPYSVLLSATISAGFATILSLWTIWLQLKNYRKITLQRFVVRILIMVPIYSLSSLISLYSLDLAFFVDALRDVYEAFVIYCFFTLLVEYLGGERSLIILLHGRKPVSHPWPISTFLHPLDVSDPYTYLGIKRGILQYVQAKPALAAITVLLKATGNYNDGSFQRDSGYTYVTIATNVSVTLSLYCLAMFWVATHDDLQPYRPMPKFLCVKGIIFFSFWQACMVSILVSTGAIKSSLFPTEIFSLAIQDTMVCFEMPLFAFMHLYAFSHTDYIDQNHQYSGRLPFTYAFRDAFGYKDVFSDSVMTVKGTGFSYRTFEPAEGGIHQGLGRDRRVRAGLRYADGGKTKYWLPMPGEEADAHGRQGGAGIISRPLHAAKRLLEDRLDYREGYAPLNEDDANDVIHDDPRSKLPEDEYERWLEEDGMLPREYDGDSDEESLGFGGPDKEDDLLFREARKLEFGDYNYPIVDASREEARRRMREEEEGIVHKPRHHRKLQKSKGKSTSQHPPPERRSSYGHYAEPPLSSPPHETSHPSAPATSKDHPAPEGHLVVDGARHFFHAITGNDEESMKEEIERRKKEEVRKLPPDAIDLVVEDKQAEEEEMVRDRRRGEPGGKKKKVYRQTYIPGQSLSVESEIVPGTLIPEGVNVNVRDSVVEEGENGEQSSVLRITVEEDEQTALHVGPPVHLLQHKSSDSSETSDHATTPRHEPEHSENPWT